jgi:hypothetical protein
MLSTADVALAWHITQVWRASHPPARGSYWLFTRPMVHWGFLNTWQASGLQAKVG